jgi:hypothetical protein
MCLIQNPHTESRSRLFKLTGTKMHYINYIPHHHSLLAIHNNSATCKRCRIHPDRVIIANSVENLFVVLFIFLGWGETESTWYVCHCLAYCTDPDGR